MAATVTARLRHLSFPRNRHSRDLWQIATELVPALERIATKLIHPCRGKTTMHARVSLVVPLGDASFPATSATDAFIGAFSWKPLSGGGF
jgi:hypothetical protein